MALAALKGDKTLVEVSQQYEVHPNQVTKWRRQLQEGAAELCESDLALMRRIDTTDFCVEAVEEAIARYGVPEIFNTDQGCPFTSLEFTQLLTRHGMTISMDGQGCWRDNVFVERLWKSIKYEEVYLHAYETVRAAQDGFKRYSFVL